MTIGINTKRLENLIRKFGGYQAVQDASKDKEGKHRITARTLYNLVAGGGWRNDTISIVCEILGVSPSEIVEFKNGDNGHTHVSPQPEKEVEQVTLEGK